MGDLVSRLRQSDRGWPTMLSTAADRIEALERENARLREALERIADTPDVDADMCCIIANEALA